MTAVPLRRALAIAAAILGLLAALAGNPYRGAQGRVDVAELASIVAHEGDHVSAVELGEWIRERKAGLRVIDLRTPEEFDDGHVPTSQNVGLESLASMTTQPGDTFVLVSAGGAHAAQAWVFLRALGIRDAYFLRGGFDEWTGEVLHPAIPADVSAGDAARFARISALSRYFGGSPHQVRGGLVPEPHGDAATNGHATRAKDEAAGKWRRGC